MASQPITTPDSSSTMKPATAITLHPRPLSAETATTTTITTGGAADDSSSNPLPPLLQTPAGLALLELQGTINLPDYDEDQGSDGAPPINIGRVDLPDWRPDSIAFDASSSAWMRRAYLYVGPHQRLTGEVRKLPRALGVVRRRRRGQGGEEEDEEEELEVLDIVKYKIVFSSRPEPVGTE